MTRIKWTNSEECKNMLITNVNETYDTKRKVENTHIYSFEKTIITGYKNPITVTCKIHGDFITTPKALIEGHGCKKCGFLNRNASHTYTLEDWINKFKEAHGNKYDYSKVSIEDIKEKGKCIIICPIHGEFWQNPIKHLGGQGCSKCAKENQGERQQIILGKKHGYTTRQLKLYLSEKFGKKYDFSKIKSKTANNFITIICPIHGEFKITAAEAKYQDILCPECRKKDFILKTDLLSILQTKWNNNQNVVICCPMLFEMDEKRCLRVTNICKNE